MVCYIIWRFVYWTVERRYAHAVWPVLSGEGSPSRYQRRQGGVLGAVSSRCVYAFPTASIRHMRAGIRRRWCFLCGYGVVLVLDVDNYLLFTCCQQKREEEVMNERDRYPQPPTKREPLLPLSLSLSLSACLVCLNQIIVHHFRRRCGH
jgi:hypothetical protein